MKFLEFELVANLSWLIVLTPFVLAAAWWTYSDTSGRTTRKAVEKMDKRRADRVEKQRAAMGMLPAKRIKK